MSFFQAVRKRGIDDPEFGQAVVRIPVGLVCVGYYFWAVNSGLPDVSEQQNWRWAFAIYFAVFTLGTVSLVYRYPGNYWPRRALAMLTDFASCIVLLSAGGEVTLPAFAALLWVTVGYGIRYGGRYLLISTGTALASLFLVIAITPYWQARPFMSAAFVLTAMIGPGYAFWLISQLQTARQEAQEANQRKSRFIAQVSHDLRQPIHAVSLLTARLSESEPTQDQAALIGKIDRSIHTAIQQLQTFLNVTSIEAGLMKPLLVPIDLGKLIEEQANQHMPLSDAPGQLVYAAPTSAIVMTDRIFLTTILQNLISNALKHAPGSEVLIGCRRRGGTLALCVYDRGGGIESGHLPRLTDRYFRLHQNDEAANEGLGLGLSIVQQLATALGLQVSIKSSPGKGTAIWISGLAPAEPGQSEAPNSAQPVLQQLKGLRVVLVEDDDATREGTAELMERWGCVVESYAHPPDVVPPCDVIVTDFEFRDNTTLVHHPHLLSANRPAIVVTGHPRDEVTRLVRNKAMTVLEKPLRAGELRSGLMSAKLALQTRA